MGKRQTKVDGAERRAQGHDGGSAKRASQSEHGRPQGLPARRELKKLKRSELLEIMLAQSEEIDRLRAELAEKERQLADKRIAIEESGSIAEASLKLTKVFMEAQRAADLYLANVREGAGAGRAGGGDDPA